MTEDEWLAAVEPVPMLASLPETTSARKLRLFACGCCRRIWHLVDDPRCRGAVAAAEGYADGWRDAAQLLAANEASYGVYAGTSEPGSAFPDAAVGMSRGSWEAAQAATLAAMPCTGGPCEAIRGAQVVAYQAEQAAAFSAHQDQRPSGFGDYLTRVARLNEQAEQADLLRDILGNPFCPAAFTPEWRTGIAVSLAQQMYDSRDFSAMPILADALQDAGCENADVLGHCRGPGPHVRGCWVVDLVLGKV